MDRRAGQGRLAIVAGSGKLPLYVAEAARANGDEPLIFPIRRRIDCRLVGLRDTSTRHRRHCRLQAKARSSRRRSHRAVRRRAASAGMERDPAEPRHDLAASEAGAHADAWRRQSRADDGDRPAGRRWACASSAPRTSRRAWWRRLVPSASMQPDQAIAGRHQGYRSGRRGCSANSISGRASSPSAVASWRSKGRRARIP